MGDGDRLSYVTHAIFFLSKKLLNRNDLKSVFKVGNATNVTLTKDRKSFTLMSVKVLKIPFTFIFRF